jgi:hypothetical protein
MEGQISERSVGTLRKANTTSLLRMVLAFAAFLAIAGPGVMLAQSPLPSYPDPQYGNILGSGLGPYSLVVHFFNGPAGEQPVSGHFTARLGTISPDGATYSPPSTGHADLITATYSNSGGSVHVSKLITF